MGLIIVLTLVFLVLGTSIRLNRRPSSLSCTPRYDAANTKIEVYVERLVSNPNATTLVEFEMLLKHVSFKDLPSSVTSITRFKKLFENMAKFRGRESVDAAMKRYQRFVQQLDRSDGRPDIGYDVLSEKYLDFISICLRTSGEAWMVAVAGLQYVGILRDNFMIEERNNGKYKVVDLGQLVYTTLRLLLDLDGEKVKVAANSGDVEAVRKAISLQIAITRSALRYSVRGVNEGGFYK